MVLTGNFRRRRSVTSAAASTDSKASTSIGASPRSNDASLETIVGGKLQEIANRLVHLAGKNPRLAKAALRRIEKLVKHLDDEETG